MKRELHVNVVVNHEALAGVIEYLRSQKIVVHSMSEAVGLGIEMLYGTLIEEGRTRPIATMEMAQIIFQALGLRNQKVEKRGLLKIARTQAEQQERIDYYMQSEGKSEKVAMALVGLESREAVELSLGNLPRGNGGESQLGLGQEDRSRRGIAEPPSKELLDDLRKRGILEGE